MKGYKGFGPGLICRGKQYAENTVFEEDTAKICESGMHFCENFSYDPVINDFTVKKRTIHAGTAPRKRKARS